MSTISFSPSRGRYCPAGWGSTRFSATAAGGGCWGPSFLSSTCPQGPEVSCQDVNSCHILGVCTSGRLPTALSPLNPVPLPPAADAGGEQEGSWGESWLLGEKCAACQMLHPSERAVLSQPSATVFDRKFVWSKLFPPIPTPSNKFRDPFPNEYERARTCTSETETELGSFDEDLSCSALDDFVF